jgi:hypothetical protein
MPNYIDDDTALPATRIDRRPIPPGEDERKFDDAAYHNALLQFCEDARDAIQALQDGGTGGTISELRITPEGAWYEGEGTYLTAGTINDYVHPSLQTRTILCVKGADNQGTTLTGLSATGINPGDVRIIMDVQEYAHHQDVGTILFKHDSADSLEGNRFMCPGQYDYIQSPNGMTILIYGEDLCWHILSNNGRRLKTITQSLQFYPKSMVGQAGAVSGTVHDYEPTGWAGMGGLGISGTQSLFKDHSMIEFVVALAGLNITGFNVQSLQADPAYYGAIKVISNRGPGVLTLKHQTAGSEIKNRIYCPGAVDVVLQPNEAAWIYYGYHDPDTTQPNWRVIGLAQNRSEFTDIEVTASATVENLEARNFNTGTSITPTALPGSAVNDYNPTDSSSGLSGRLAYWWFVQGNIGTELTGIEAAPAGYTAFRKGDRILLSNLGSGMTIKNGDVRSAAANRFVLTSDIVLSANGSHEFIYNGSRWMSTSFQ